MQYTKNFQQIQINHLEDSDFDLESPIQILVKLKEEDSIKLANKVLEFWESKNESGNGEKDIWAWEESFHKDNEITKLFFQKSEVVWFAVGKYSISNEFPFAEIIMKGQIDQDSNSTITEVLKDLLNWLDQHLLG